jgi:hypothetical protein
MAQGDVLAQIADVLADSALVIQPAAGESWRVEDVFAAGDGTSSGYFQYYDGTDVGTSESTSADAVDLNSYRIAKAGPGILPIYINNSLYLQIYNNGGVAMKCGLIALQIK